METIAFASVILIALLSGAALYAVMQGVMLLQQMRDQHRDLCREVSDYGLALVKAVERCEHKLVEVQKETGQVVAELRAVPAPNNDLPAGYYIPKTDSEGRETGSLVNLQDALTMKLPGQK